MHSHSRWACGRHLLRCSPPLPLPTPPLPGDGSWLFLIFPSAQSGRGLLSPPKGSPSELWARWGQRALQNQDNLISLPQAPPWKTGHSFPALVPGTSKLALRGAGEGSRAQASGILLRPAPKSGETRLLAEVCRPRGGQLGSACYCSLPQMWSKCQPSVLITSAVCNWLGSQSSQHGPLH